MRPLALLLILSLLYACQNDLLRSDDALNIIPQNTTMVARVDIPTLLKKADFDDIRNNERYQKAIADAREKNPALAKAMENPENAGIDLDKMGYFFSWINPENSNERFNGLSVSLSDAAQFEALMGGEGKEIKKKGPMRYFLEDGDKIAAWTEEVAIFGSSSALSDLAARAEKIFQTKASESIAGNKSLQEALAKRHDFTWWLDAAPLAAAPEVQLGASFAELDPASLMSNNISGYLDFLDGRITGEADFYLDPNLGKELDKLFNDEVDNGFAKYFPERDLGLLLTNAINIRGIAELINARKQARGFTDFSLQAFGLSLEDIAATFSGDIALAAVGQPGSDKKVGLFAARILDEQRLQKFLDLGVEREQLVLERDRQYLVKEAAIGSRGDFFHISFDDGAPRLLVKDGYLFICGDEEWLYRLENGGFPAADRLQGDLFKQTRGQLFTLYMNAASLNAAGNAEGRQAVKDLSLQLSREKAAMEIRMIDPNKNALRTILENEEKKTQ